MSETVLAITYLVIFIPGIFLFYFLLQCFKWDQTIKAGKAQYFKALYILICIILASLLAIGVVNTIDRLTTMIGK